MKRSLEEQGLCSSLLEQRRARLLSTPIIAAVSSADNLRVALQSPAQAVYLLFGTPLNLPGYIAETCAAGKLCMINLDFLEGLSRDRHAVEFLAAHGADGIVSTKSEVLRTAKALGLVTVLRTFIIDSAAVTATIKTLAPFVTDAVEILPAAIALKVGARFRGVHPTLHIIGGGLVENVREIEALFQAGVHSITVSDQRLWII